MNRTDRIYALVEELRAAGPRGRTARQLAAHFEVSVRTIERDLSALGQAAVPLATKQGRAGGYTLDRSMSLPPLNFTAREAAAVAVALSRSEHVLFKRDARTALQKIVAAMPERALQKARATAERVRLLVLAAPDPDADVAETIWKAVRDNHVLFRMDRITRAERSLVPRRAPDGIAEPVVDGHETRLPAAALRPEDLLPNTDIGLSRTGAKVGTSRHAGG
jgi:predicted DNA-binding transcriptional regulator YafY